MRSHRLRYLVCCICLACLPCRLVAQEVPKATGREETDPQRVSAEEIRKLRAKWVDPEAETTDANKIRRYESILREGRRLLRENAHAENLYIVRAMMLQASRGLLILGVNDIDRQGVIRLAEGVVNSSAPPGWRIEADTLLTQLRLAGEAEKPEQLEGTIERYLGRYENSETTPAALMRAAQMAQQYKMEKLYSSYIERLREEFLDHEGVGNFLVRQGEKIPREGRSFTCRIPRVNEGEMILPLDLMGQTSVILFWDPRSLPGREHLATMGRKLRQEPRPGLGGLLISTDAELSRVRKVLAEAQPTFPSAYLEQQSLASVMEFFGVNEIPMYFLVGPDGRIFDTPRHFHGMWWRGTEDAFLRYMWRQWRRASRLQLTRSGLFLLTDIRPGAEAKLADQIDRIQHVLLAHAPGAKRVEAMQQVLEAFQPEADRLEGHQAKMAAVMSLALQRWIALGQRENRLQADWVKQAKALADDPLPGPAGLLADFFVLLADVHEAQNDAADAMIRRFVLEHESTRLEFQARMLALALSLEKGLDAPRRSLQGTLCDVHSFDRPLVRGYVRDTTDIHPEIEARLRFELPVKALDGEKLSLGKGIEGEAIVVHFWSAGAPIASAGIPERQDPVVSPYALAEAGEGVTIVAVNVDGNLQAAKELAAKHPDWVHGLCPQGWADPLLRSLGVTRMPSTWIFGYDGGVLVDDNHTDTPDALEHLQTMSTWVLYWRDIPVDQWYLRTMRLWSGFQAGRAAMALYGEDLFPQKRADEYRRGYKWALDSGLRNSIRTSADPIHREILSILADSPEGEIPSQAARKRLARLHDRLRRFEPYLQKVQDLIETSPDWPDWAPREGIEQGREMLYRIEKRRFRPDKETAGKLDALLKETDSGWSLEPRPEWLDRPETRKEQQ